MRPYEATSKPTANTSIRREIVRRALVRPIAAFSQLVTDVDRDRAYREILDQLGDLDPADRADLLRRGFTDEDIETAGIKSWEANRQLVGDFPAGLPGLKGKTLSARSGYLIPIRDSDGLICGLQVRSRDAGKTGSNGEKIPGYTWVSNPDAPIGGEQEWPLAFFPGKGSEPVCIVEGVGAKPFLTAKHYQFKAVIGGAGGLWAKSPERLKSALKKAGVEKGDRVYLAADAGWHSNPNVKRHYTELFKQLRKWGLTLCVLGWGQHQTKRKGDKNRGDIDEIAPSVLFDILKWTRPDQEEIDNGIGYLWDAVDEAIDRDRYDALVAFNIQPDLTTTGRYIPADNWKSLSKPGLALTRAVPDSGKSFANLKPMIRAALDQGKRVLSITVRRSLGYEQCDKFGLEFLSGDDSVITSKGVSCCWESLHKLKGQKFDLIVLDEIRLGATIANTSGTLRGKRAKCRSALEVLLTETIANGGTIACCDADIDDRLIKYLCAVANVEKPAIVHLHDQLPVARNVYTVRHTDFLPDGTKIKGWLLSLALFRQHILRTYEQLAQGKPFASLDDLPMFVADSQSMIEDLSAAINNEIGGLAENKKPSGECDDSAKKIEAAIDGFLKNLDQEIQIKFPNLAKQYPILRIDRKTSSDPESLEYISQPIEGKGRSIAVMLSPSGFVGVSDEDDRIRTVYAVFYGVVGVNLARQALGRARRAQNWVVAYADAFSLGDGRPSRSFDPVEVLRDMSADVWGPDGIKAVTDLAIEKFGADAGAITEYLEKSLNRESNLWANPHTQFTAEEWAISNYERAHFGELLIERLECEGHRMLSAFDALHLAGIEVENESDRDRMITELLGINGSIKAARKERQQHESEALAKAAMESELTAEEARGILEEGFVYYEDGDGEQKKRPATEDDRLEAKGAILRDRYPGLMDVKEQKPVFTDPELAQEFFMSWEVKGRANADRAFRHWVFKNPDTHKAINYHRHLDFLREAAQGKNFSSLEDRHFDQRVVIAEKLLRDFSPEPGKVFGGNDGNDVGKIREAWKKLSDWERKTLGVFPRTGPRSQIDFTANLLDVAGFNISRKKKAVMIVEGDRFFDGAIEAINRAQQQRLEELINPDLRLARRDRERQAREDRRAARAAAFAAQLEARSAAITPEVKPTLVTQAIAPVEIPATPYVAAVPSDPERLEATAQRLASELGGEVIPHPVENARKLVMAGDWRIEISEDAGYKSGFKFDAVDTSGGYRVAVVRDIQAKIQEVRDWLVQKPAAATIAPDSVVKNQEPIAPVENTPNPETTNDSAYDRAVYLYQCWASGAIAQAAAAVQTWQRAIDPIDDPMGFARLRTAVCSHAQGLEDYWRYATMVAAGTIAAA